MWVIRADPSGDFNFVAGQYATVGVQTPEGHFERPYSIVSAPHEPLLEFFFELVPQGHLTPRLYAFRPGDEFTIRKKAKGRLTFDSDSGHKNHLLIATVTGVAPYVSYTRSFYKDWKDKKFGGEHRLFLLDGASRSRELGYREELERIAAEVPWLTYVPTVSRPWEDSTWKGETGRVDDLIRKYADQWNLTPESATAYLCGNPGMIENVTGILQRRGWNEKAIRREAFFKDAPGHQA